MRRPMVNSKGFNEFKPEDKPPIVHNLKLWAWTSWTLS